MHDRLSGRTLAIATGHDLSLALLDGDTLLAEGHWPVARGHAERLLPAIADLLAPFGGAAASLAQIVVEVGPGSFTGLRVGIAAARALGLGWRLPVLGVRSTLLAAAECRAAGVAGPLVVLLVAPRGQVWLETFAAGTLDSLGPPVARPAGAVAAVVPVGGAAVGSGAGSIAGEVGRAPRAAAVAHVPVGALQPPVPLYVREEPLHRAA